MIFSPQRYSLLSAAINSVLYGTFSFVDLHTMTSGGLKTASYMTLDHTKCEVTCDHTDPNCARTFKMTASLGLPEDDADYEAWQNCKNKCTDLQECTGFDIRGHASSSYSTSTFYTCILYYQFIHTCHYQVGSMCTVKECNTPLASDAFTNTQCSRMGNADEWGMTYPMLWQQPAHCPADNRYCKREGEMCDNDRSFCHENENLICVPDCRQYSICKRTPTVDASALVTHALLQCPFVQHAAVPECDVKAPDAPQTTEFTGAITQDALSTGTYKITRPGTYKIMEDLTFEFQEAPFASHSQQGLHAGKVNGIEILADDVILDLNGKTLQQSGAQFRKQRFFTHIVIGNQVFSKGVGNFASDLIPRKRIVIKNGTLGRTSHFGIRGMESQDVLVENVSFRDFEVAAVSFSAAKRIKIHQCVLDNANFATTVSFRFGVFFQLFRTMRFLESSNVQDPVGTSPRFPQDFFTHSVVANMLLDASSSSEVQSNTINEFVAKSGPHAQGNVYGVHVTNCEHVEVNDVDISHLSNMNARVKAVRAIGDNGPVFNVDMNALLYDWFWDDEGNRIDNKETMTELESLRVFLFKAQVWAKKQFGGSHMDGIDDHFVRRVLDPSKPEMRDVLPWTGNDVRGHKDTGVHGISIKSGSRCVKIIGVSISNIRNTVPQQNASSSWSTTIAGSFLNSAPNVWRAAAGSHRVHHAADAYGINIASSQQVHVQDVNIRSIRSDSMHAFGVAVIGASKDVGVRNVQVDGASLQVGSVLRTQNLTLPNLKAKAMPFYRDSAGQENVAFMDITPQHLYVAPSANCDFSPNSVGCPPDGNWEQSACDGEPSLPPVHCEATVSDCNAETCRITVTTTQLAANGGKACSYADGASYHCCEEEVPLTTTPSPVHCVGYWSSCDSNCFKTFVVSRPSSHGGMLCPYSAGEEMACSNTAGCKTTTNPDASNPINCVFEIAGECDEKCTKQVNIIRPAQNGGTSCPDFSALSGRIRADCNGSGTDGKCMPSVHQACEARWAACDVATCWKRWEIQKYPSGAFPACAYAHGTLALCDPSDASRCTTTPAPQHCVGTWSACNSLTCRAVFVVTQVAIDGQPCTYEPGEVAGFGTNLDHFLVCPNTGKCGARPPTPPGVCRWSACTSECTRMYEATREDCPMEHGISDDGAFCMGGMGACRAQHCEGDWGACGADCMRTFTMSQSPAFGGSDCSQVNNAKCPSDCFVDGVGKDSCVSAPTYTDADCQGSFSQTCNAACKRTFVVSVMDTGEGAPCTSAAGLVGALDCDQGNCADPPTTHQDCVYKWSGCNASCKRTFVVVVAPSTPFTQCPYPEGFQSATDCAPGLDYCPCPASDPTCADGCKRWTTPEACNVAATCAWDSDAEGPKCGENECVLLSKEACDAAQNCFADVKEGNRCTLTGCPTHTSQQPCEQDANCLFDVTTSVCVQDVCKDHDLVTCDQQTLCAWDRHGDICRQDKCAHIGNDACATQSTLCCMGTPQIAAKFSMLDMIDFTASEEKYNASPLSDYDAYTTPTAQTCIPSHCDAATSPEACEARNLCYVATASPLSCQTNPCAAVGFSGTEEECNAIEGCIHSGRYCRPAAPCANFDGDADACRAVASDCVYDVASAKCVQHACSARSLQEESERCNAELQCFFKDKRFDKSVPKSTPCRGTACVGLTAAQCVTDPGCYVDRTDGSTCRANPCESTAGGEEDCNNALCAWQSSSARCEPKPFPVATCDSIQADLSQCEISPHCYVEDGKCLANPCNETLLEACNTAHCFVNHAVGSVCKPAKPCAQSVGGAGCAKNPLCKNGDSVCVRKPCEELSETECQFSFSSNKYCTYVGNACQKNICSDLVQQECGADNAACIWDTEYTGAPSPPAYAGHAQCMRNPCHGLKQDDCKAVAACHFTGAGVCIWNPCTAYKENQATCDADVNCYFADSTCKVTDCRDLDNDRQVCVGRPECTHDSSTKKCVFDTCIHHSATDCASATDCTYNYCTSVCTPITLCHGLGVASCDSARGCYYHQAKKSCNINFCQFGDKETCQSYTNKYPCVWALQNSESNTHKCVHDQCLGAEKGHCQSTDTCFWGADNVNSTRKTCTFDGCKIYRQKECDAVGKCQWRDGKCKPNKTCLGALWSDAKCTGGKILVNPGTKLCTTCLQDECCETGKRSQPQPPKDEEDSNDALIIGIIVASILVLLLLCCLFCCCFCLKKDQSDEEELDPKDEQPEE